jgi:8-oxo-dGTP diphosphatase
MLAMQSRPVDSSLVKPTSNVAAAIALRGDRVLVTRRAIGQKMAGLWEFPGGKLEVGETVQACIVREIAEELSVACVAGEVFCESLHQYDGGAINLIAVLVSLDSDCWQLSVHDEARWVGPDELMQLDLAPADIPIAKKLCLQLLVADINGAR